MGCPPGLTGPGSSVHPSGGDAGHGVGGRVLGEGGQEEPGGRQRNFYLDDGRQEGVLGQELGPSGELPL